MNENQDPDVAYDNQLRATRLDRKLAAARERIEQLVKENLRALEAIEHVYNAGINGIEYVASPNYAERGRDARKRLREAREEARALLAKGGSQ